MHDFFCTDTDYMNHKELADKVGYFKEDEKGVTAMCKVMEASIDKLKEIAVPQPLNKVKKLIAGKDLTLEADEAVSFGAISGIIEKLD